MNRKKILSILRQFRKLPAFDTAAGRDGQAFLWKSGWKNWLIWNLFQSNQLWLLYELLYGKRRADALIAGLRRGNRRKGR